MSKTADTNYRVKAITDDKKWKVPGTSQLDHSAHREQTPLD